MMHTNVRASLGLLAAALIALAGCGPKVSVEEVDGKVTGDLVHVEGELQLRGNMPQPELILVTAGAGQQIKITSDELRDELRSLAGMPIAVEGELKRKSDDLPRIEAKRYQLLRLATGEQPLVGMLSLEEGECVLSAGDGKRYWIRGDLTGVIRDYGGAKIWVVGSKGDAADASQPRGTVAYWVTGYGVLVEAPER
jgi:hypothetical protein